MSDVLTINRGEVGKRAGVRGLFFSPILLPRWRKGKVSGWRGSQSEPPARVRGLDDNPVAMDDRAAG